MQHCLRDGGRGKPIAELLRPEPSDYFVLKPKHSGFFSTTLDTLLEYLEARTLIMTGMATNICVLFTANDAYMRDYQLAVPSDCVAANSKELNDHALMQIRDVLKADTRPSTDIELDALIRRDSESEKSDNRSMSNRWRSVGPPGQRGRVLTLGHGRHVVVLVSPLARGENYVPTARALARHFQVHLFEMPGSGAGTRLQSPWTMVDYADWSAEMIAQCGMEGSAVVGHSYAGMVAVALAARHPTLMSALVVADTPGVGEPVTLARGVLGAIADVARDILIVSTAWPLVAWNALVHRRNVWRSSRNRFRLTSRSWREIRRRRHSLHGQARVWCCGRAAKELQSTSKIATVHRSTERPHLGGQSVRNVRIRRRDVSGIGGPLSL